MIFYWDIINEDYGKVTVDICNSVMEGDVFMNAFMLSSHKGWEISLSLDNFTSFYKVDLDTKSDKFDTIREKHRGDWYAAFEEVLFTSENIKGIIEGIFR